MLQQQLERNQPLTQCPAAAVAAAAAAAATGGLGVDVFQERSLSIAELMFPFDASNALRRKANKK